MPGGIFSLLLRLPLSVLLAAIVTMVLFHGMQYLVSTADSSLGSAEKIQFLDFVRLKREEVIERKKQKPARPPEAKPAPPPPPSMKLDQASPDVHKVEVAVPEVAVDMKLGSAGFNLDLGEGDYLPLVKVAPAYPRRAAARGIEGYCIVEYTVTVIGTTRDVKLVPDACSHRLFEQPSLDAAARFKYKPRVIDGQSIEVHGVRNKFSYELRK